MAIPTADNAAYTDIGSLTGLKAKAHKSSQSALGEVAAQFEAMFIQMMLKSAREAKLSDDDIFNSNESELYHEMFDKQVSIDMARHGGIGLSEMLIRQLGQNPTVSSTPIGVSAPEKVSVHINAAAVPTSASTSMDAAEWTVKSPEEFVRAVLPHARRAGEKLGVKPETLVAQAALETGWGSAMPRRSDGRPSFNLFGIKADSSWHGDKVVNKTLEYSGDAGLQRQSAAFRAYDSIGAAFDDYAAFIGSQPRYGHARQLGGDSAAYVQSLQDSGYATDPQYAQKILRVMDRAADLMAAAEGKYSASDSLTMAQTE